MFVFPCLILVVQNCVSAFSSKNVVRTTFPMANQYHLRIGLHSSPTKSIESFHSFCGKKIRQYGSIVYSSSKSQDNFIDDSSTDITLLPLTTTDNNFDQDKSSTQLSSTQLNIKIEIQNIIENRYGKQSISDSGSKRNRLRQYLYRFKDDYKQIDIKNVVNVMDFLDEGKTRCIELGASYFYSQLQRSHKYHENPYCDCFFLSKQSI